MDAFEVGSTGVWLARPDGSPGTPEPRDRTPKTHVVMTRFLFYNNSNLADLTQMYKNSILFLAIIRTR